MIKLPTPMLATDDLRLPFTDPDWLYEIKHDGYRCIAGIDAASEEPLGGRPRNVQRVHLETSAGTDCSAWFPEIIRDLDLLPAGPHVIDGEACVLRDDGTSDFKLLQERARRRTWYPGAPAVTLCCFDLLMCNGKPTMHLPLTRRKELLRALIDLIDDPKPGLLVVGDLPADAEVFQAVVDAGLAVDGVVARKRDSLYVPGERTREWVQLKGAGWPAGRASDGTGKT